MKLFITVGNQIAIVENDQVIYHPLNEFAHGIEIFNNQLFIAVREFQSIIDYNIKVFDLKFNLIKTLQSPYKLQDVHEIMIHNNKLWITCAYDDKIVIYDFETDKWQEWYPLGIPEPIPNIEDIRKYDHHHFNSIMIDENYIYLMANNLQYAHSELHTFDLSFNHLSSIQIGKQSHNIWEKGDELLVCSSAEQKIIGTKGFNLDLSDKETFIRGVTITPEGDIYIGASLIAPREERQLLYSKIYHLDKNYKLLDTFTMDQIGAIYAIRIV
ncbi:MAG: hypothetical protein M1542_08585 [Thermotogae bacterium]|jgi:hypothetical protein|nr:hypothetical protein [Thermotogota bacterium]